MSPREKYQIPNGLVDIVQKINMVIFTHMFKLNILDMRQNYQTRIGASASHTLHVGDVCFDRYTFEKCKNYASLLFLISYINPSNTWLLLTKPKSLMALMK